LKKKSREKKSKKQGPLLETLNLSTDLGREEFIALKFKVVSFPPPGVLELR